MLATRFLAKYSVNIPSTQNKIKGMDRMDEGLNSNKFAFIEPNIIFV